MIILKQKNKREAQTKGNWTGNQETVVLFPVLQMILYGSRQVIYNSQFFSVPSDGVETKKVSKELSLVPGSNTLHAKNTVT
jgi:hypothetical protein